MKGWKVTVEKRIDNPKKCAQICKRELELQREMLHIEADLRVDGFGTPGQYYNIGPKDMIDRSMERVHVAAPCLSNALPAASEGPSNSLTKSERSRRPARVRCNV